MKSTCFELLVRFIAVRKAETLKTTTETQKTKKKQELKRQQKKKLFPRIVQMTAAYLQDCGPVPTKDMQTPPPHLTRIFIKVAHCLIE